MYDTNAIKTAFGTFRNVINKHQNLSTKLQILTRILCYLVLQALRLVITEREL